MDASQGSAIPSTCQGCLTNCPVLVSAASNVSANDANATAPASPVATAFASAPTSPITTTPTAFANNEPKPADDAPTSLASVRVKGNPAAESTCPGKQRAAAAFVAERSIDPNSFTEAHTHGLITWWNEELKDMTPEWAAEECGVAADAIRDMARAFAAAGPRAISWVSPGVAMCARGLYASMACYALNGLTGSVGPDGAVLKFPFIFAQHRSRLSLEGRSANTKRFQDLKGTDPDDEPWDDVLKIHPDDMHTLGLASGDTIRIISVQGSITCHAKEWDGTRPGVVVKCYRQGHWAYGRNAALDFDRGIARGGNNNEIIPPEYERVSGATARHGGLARVRVELVERQRQESRP